MSKKFKLLGRRVLINFPKRPDSKIELTPEVERQLEEEMVKKWTNLEVYAIGEDVTTLKAGDKVYIPAEVLKSAERLNVNNDAKLMISEYDVAVIW
jgi:hypothetical protein